VYPRPSALYYLTRKRRTLKKLGLPHLSGFPDLSKDISDDDLEQLWRFRCSNPKLSSSWADSKVEGDSFPSV